MKNYSLYLNYRKETHENCSRYITKYKNILKVNTGQEFDNGSAIGLYTDAIAHTLEDVYAEIENNKTPHVWSFLQNETLDSTGEWVNLPRATGESDNQYKYRLMNWMLINEAANNKSNSINFIKSNERV